MKKPVCILFCLLAFLEMKAQVQPFLLLQKPGNINKRIRYYPGDDIDFKLKNAKDFVEGTVMGFSDTSFVLVSGADIPIRQVEKIRRKGARDGFRAIGTKAFYAIPVFFIFSAANNLFNTGKRPLIDKEVYILSGVFGGIGLISFAIPDKKYNLKNRWHLSVVRM